MEVFKRACALAAVCIISALVLSLVYSQTTVIIERVKAQEILNTKKDLVPMSTRFELAQGDNLETCFDSYGREVGKIVYIDFAGHNGDIAIMVGVSSTGEVTGLKVINNNETPGLGSKISGQEFVSQFIGKNYYSLSLRQDSSKGEIDGVSGATISSRAVVDAVRSAVSVVTSRDVNPSRDELIPGSYAYSRNNYSTKPGSKAKANGTSVMGRRTISQGSRR